MTYRDPEERRAYGREWMRRNPEKAREAMRRWRQRNPELRRVRDRQYKRTAYLRRGAEVNALKAEYLRSHPEVRRAKDQAYRARRAVAAGVFTGKQWLALTIAFGGACGYCGEVRPLEPEHRIPLSRGGDNSIANIIPACRRCNARKATRTEAEFRALLRRERVEHD